MPLPCSVAFTALHLTEQIVRGEADGIRDGVGRRLVVATVPHELGYRAVKPINCCHVNVVIIGLRLNIHYGAEELYCCVLNVPGHTIHVIVRSHQSLHQKNPGPKGTSASRLW
jgi:hypothetical protein